MTITPYIIFNGRCEEALNFYAKALGGEIENLMRFSDAPPSDMPPVAGNQVMHAQFRAGELFFMASDSFMTSGSGAQGSDTTGMLHLSLDFTDPGEQEKVFTLLGEGGKVTMPLNDTFWGARFGMLTDRFGVNWMFNHDKGGKP